MLACDSGLLCAVPGTPEEVSVTEQEEEGEEGLVVTWNPVIGLVTGYNVMVERTDRGDMQVFSSSDTLRLVSSQDVGGRERVRVQITAVNTAGYGPPSTPRTSRTPSIGQSPSPPSPLSFPPPSFPLPPPPSPLPPPSFPPPSFHSSSLLPSPSSSFHSSSLLPSPSSSLLTFPLLLPPSLSPSSPSPLLYVYPPLAPGPVGVVNVTINSADTATVSWSSPEYPNGILTGYTVSVELYVNDRVIISPVNIENNTTLSTVIDISTLSEYHCGPPLSYYAPLLFPQWTVFHTMCWWWQ